MVEITTGRLRRGTGANPGAAFSFHGDRAVEFVSIHNIELINT